MTKPNILCATDLTDEGSRAVDVAIAAARAIQGRVELLHVTDSAADAEPDVLPDSMSAGTDALRARIRRRVEEDAARLEAERKRVGSADLPVEALLAEGRPWEAIVREASDRGAALVVLGRRPRKMEGFAGPTIDHVVRHAPCPVLVAPPHGEGPAGFGGGPWLVGVDLSRQCISAIRAARALAHRAGGEVVLVHVVPSTGAEGKTYEEKTPGQLLREQSLVEERAALAALATKEAPDARLLERVSLERTADVLLEVAEELSAAMIVVGTHGRAGLSRLFLGSTADALLRRAERPVLVLRDAPPHAAPWYPRPEGEPQCLGVTHLLVAVDFSDASRRALALAAVLSAQLELRVDVVHVHESAGDIRRGLLGRLPSTVEASADDAEAAENLEDALKGLVAETFGKQAQDVRHRVVVGRPVESLLEIAASAGADLIVVGTTGKAGIERVLLGSVAEKLVRSARVGVLTVH